MDPRNAGLVKLAVEPCKSDWKLARVAPPTVDIADEVSSMKRHQWAPRGTKGLKAN